MKFFNVNIILSLIAISNNVYLCQAEVEDLKDFSFALESESKNVSNQNQDEEYYDETNTEEDLAVAQESKNIARVHKSPLLIARPIGVTNSHRPQYNIDSFEVAPSERKEKVTPYKVKLEVDDDDVTDFFDENDKIETKPVEKEYKPSNRFRVKELMVKQAVVKALERKEHIKKFAQILPILRAMTPTQRLALASLVANQVTTHPSKQGLNLQQVRSMFGNNPNVTSDLMLPILLDMANLFRRASRLGKEARETRGGPSAQFLRRSLDEDEGIDLSFENDYYKDNEFDEEPFSTDYDAVSQAKFETESPTTTDQPITTQSTIFSVKIDNKLRTHLKIPNTSKNTQPQNNTQWGRDNHYRNGTEIRQQLNRTKYYKEDAGDLKVSTTPIVAVVYPTSANSFSESIVNATQDQIAASSNDTLSEDLPVAEKLRALNRFIDRRGNLIGIRRPWTPASKSASVGGDRRPAPTASTAQRRRLPPRKAVPIAPTQPDEIDCELFTNSLCLEVNDYPSDAILTSLRRNKAVASALMSDFRELGSANAVDGVSSKQEVGYTPEHYYTSNRREDGGNSVRDFAGAGEAGFMCPSTVKYARPQRARATSGQWKYIVNTGEHTQTLRLEKCLRPKEPCTYLTDNFKSKCVQVYNYHRLLTWDQQNGLHMDIFKVPTCCSCHIEGYSVSFPPLAGRPSRPHETSSEQFPGDDLSHEADNNSFENGQSTMIHHKTTPYTYKKHPPTDSFNYFGDGAQNSIPSTGFHGSSIVEDDPTLNIHGSQPMDSYGNTYVLDSHKQGSSIRNVKKPLRERPNVNSNSAFETVTLPSYLEPPSQQSIPISSTYFGKGQENPSKYKQYTGNTPKRGVKRPARRPIRKKTSNIAGDLIPSGSSFESQTIINMETFDDINNEPDNYQTETTKRPLISKFISSTPSYTTTRPVTMRPSEQGTAILKDISLNKRVNYNYHPIIDFFENVGKEPETEASDRADDVSTFIPSMPIESEWKPISLPGGPSNTRSIESHRHRS